MEKDYEGLEALLILSSINSNSEKEVATPEIIDISNLFPPPQFQEQVSIFKTFQ
jgi:hypothetical protein